MAASLLVLVVFFEVGLPILTGDGVAEAFTKANFYVAIPMMLIVLAIAGIAPIIQLRARKKQGWDIPMLVRLSDDGISVDHPKGGQRMIWNALRKVRATRDRLFLFTTPACAFIIPKRCFESEAEFQRWIAYSEQRWTEAKSA